MKQYTVNLGNKQQKPPVGVADRLLMRRGGVQVSGRNMRLEPTEGTMRSRTWAVAWQNSPSADRPKSACER